MDEAQSREKKAFVFALERFALAQEIESLMQGEKRLVGVAAILLVLDAVLENTKPEFAKFVSDELFDMSVKYLKKANGET